MIRGFDDPLHDSHQYNDPESEGEYDQTDAMAKLEDNVSLERRCTAR